MRPEHHQKTLVACALAGASALAPRADAPPADFAAEGHMQIVNCCRWAPDGSAIISGSSDRCIRGWRLQDNGDGDMSKFKWGNGTVLEFAFGDCSSSLAV